MNIPGRLFISSIIGFRCSKASDSDIVSLFYRLLLPIWELSPVLCAICTCIFFCDFCFLHFCSNLFSGKHLSGLQPVRKILSCIWTKVLYYKLYYISSATNQNIVPQKNQLFRKKEKLMKIRLTPVSHSWSHVVYCTHSHIFSQIFPYLRLEDCEKFAKTVSTMFWTTSCEKKKFFSEHRTFFISTKR